MESIKEQATAGINIIESISDQIASYIVLSNDTNTMMRVFQGMQMELATTIATGKSTITGQPTEEQVLIKEASRLIVDFVKAVSETKRGQQEVLMETFISVQQRTHVKI